MARPFFKGKQMVSDFQTTVQYWDVFPHMDDNGVDFRPRREFLVLVKTGSGGHAIIRAEFDRVPDWHVASVLASQFDGEDRDNTVSMHGENNLPEIEGLAANRITMPLNYINPLTVTRAFQSSVADHAECLGIHPADSLSRATVHDRVVDSFLEEWMETRQAFGNAIGLSETITIPPGPHNNFARQPVFDPEFRRLCLYRHQAFSTFPFLQKLLKNDEFDPVRDVIDRGQTLVHALAVHFNVPRSMIRALRGVAVRDLGELIHKLPSVFQIFAAIPPERWPSNPTEWRQFRRSIKEVIELSRLPATFAPNLVWLGKCARNNWQLPLSNGDRLPMGLADVENLTRALLVGLEWFFYEMPELITRFSFARREAMARNIVARLRKKLGYRKLVQMYRQYKEAHRRAVIDHAAQFQEWNDQQWPSLISENQCYGNLVVNPLPSMKELHSEGVAMNHCVVTLWEGGIRGQSQFWSVRTKDDTRLSTFQTTLVMQDDMVLAIKIEQHMGQSNAPAPLAAEKAAQLHIDYLLTQREGIQSYLAWRAGFDLSRLDTDGHEVLLVLLETEPVVAALKEVLPEKYGMEKLVRQEARRQTLPAGLT